MKGHTIRTRTSSAATMDLSLIFLSLCVAGVNTKMFSVVSFNTGLTSRVDNYQQRRLAIGPALQELQADVVCLQEVWFSTDMGHILSRVNETQFPYSYSYLHEDTTTVQEVAKDESPCSSIKFITSFLPCLELHCRNTDDQMTYLTCAKSCGLLELLDQPCITCLILSDSKVALERCFLNHGNRFNVPGILLLSKHPLSNPKLTFFVTHKKLLIPRAYISAEIEDLGTVICTHTTANLGPLYFEDLPYDSWGTQNVHEAEMLAQVVQSAPKGLIMGDLNGGPDVSHSGVSADFQHAFTTLLNSNLKPDFIDSLGICTWCVYNPLTKSSHNKILDHVFSKNISVFGAMRIFDAVIGGMECPLSDHYGIQVIIDA